ncbi:MAG: DUF6379 domain-containing protein [Crenarchaeota archaeon]|nr:DUF6379 domain-containing protein [Thermoproteota archaeon]
MAQGIGELTFKKIADLVMLPSKTIRNVDIDKDGKIDGFEFDIREPFYTAQPISSIESLTITVDGEEIDPARIYMILRDQIFNIKHARTFHELWWHFGEVGRIYIEKPGGLEKGSHEIECSLVMRPAAGEYGFGKPTFLTRTTMKV